MSRVATCSTSVDNVEHTLLICVRWSVAREIIGQAVNAELTPDTMIPLMLQPESFLMQIKLFITLVIRTQDFNGRRKRSNESLVTGGSDCRARGRGNFHALLASAAPRFAIQRAGEGLGQTNDGKVVHDLK